MDLEIVILMLGSAFAFGTGMLTAVIAWMKGYRPWFWLFAMGPIGLLWIIMTPQLRSVSTPEERERWESRTDWSGGIFSALTVFPVFGLTMLGFFAFWGFSAAVAPATATKMATPMVIEEMSEPDSNASAPMTSQRAVVEEPPKSPQVD